jgi:hypothetical protein
VKAFLVKAMFVSLRILLSIPHHPFPDSFPVRILVILFQNLLSVPPIFQTYGLIALALIVLKID